MGPDPKGRTPQQATRYTQTSLACTYFHVGVSEALCKALQTTTGHWSSGKGQSLGHRGTGAPTCATM